MKKNRVIIAVVVMIMMCAFSFGCGKKQVESFNIPFYDTINFNSAMNQSDVKKHLESNNVNCIEKDGSVGAEAKWLDCDGIAMFIFDDENKLQSIQWGCDYSPTDMDVYTGIIDYLNRTYGEMSKTNDENIYAWNNGTVLFVLGDSSCSVQWYRSDWRKD